MEGGGGRFWFKFMWRHLWKAINKTVWHTKQITFCVTQNYSTQGCFLTTVPTFSLCFTKPDFVHLQTQKFGSPGAQTLRVATTYIHHNHNSQTLDNDIAILKLHGEADLKEGVCLVCLPARGTSQQAGKRCTVTGYGYMGESKFFRIFSFHVLSLFFCSSMLLSIHRARKAQYSNDCLTPLITWFSLPSGNGYKAFPNIN